MDKRAKVFFGFFALALVGFLVSLVARKAGSFYFPVDGWGICAFELSMAIMCLLRFFHKTWRSAHPAARMFPLVLGAACAMWAIGDVVMTIEKIGGAEPPTPSLADGFYIWFFPLCYVSFMMMLRRGNTNSVVTTSLDGLIAGLGVASISAAYLFGMVLRVAGGSALSAATDMAYAVGDLLLLALAVGGLAFVSKATRLFFVCAIVAMVANLVGDGYNLLQPDSKIGYVSDAMAWPTSLFMLSFATWLQPPTIMRRNGGQPGGFALGILGAFSSMFILASASFGHVGRVGVGLATATLLFAGIRLWVTVKERTESLAGRERHFKGLVENSSDTIAVVDPDLTVRWMSATKRSVLGWSHTEFIGKNLNEFDGMFSPIVAALKELWGGQPTKIEWELIDSEGRRRFLESTITDLIGDADIGGYVINNRDITDRTILEGQLRHQAFHDPLTGLANRALFGDRVDHALARLGRTGLKVAVLLIDLDGFKDVNDSLGHEAGDQMLCTVAESLRTCIRPGDTVARLGGDEFAVLMEDTNVEADATQLGERIRGALASTALKITNRRVTASIGIATSENSDTRAKLLRDADTAMYWAKSRGKDAVKSFEPSMHQAANERYQLQSQVKDAIEKQEFVLRYQPTFALDSGTLEGFEALIRWDHPTLGLVSPDRFIPLAEESGLISPLGRWVLQEATRELARWSADPKAPDVTMAINVSARQMRDATFVQDVKEAIDAAGVDPQRIVLEITESVLVDDPTDVMRVLHELKALGVRIAIDDFGTGYSSLSYLQNLPVDILKIDRSFVSPRGDAATEDTHSLLHAILNLAKSIGLETVAEGVEEPHQAAFLAAANCNLGQGYLWARPLTAEAARELVSQPDHVNRLARERIMAGFPNS